MIAIRLSAVLIAFSLFACQAPAPPEPARDAPSPAVERDRTIWDGLPEVRAAERAFAPSLRPGGTGALRPARRASAPRPAMVSGLRFEDEPLDEALRRLQVVTGAPILITPRGRAVIAEQAVTIDLELTAPVRLGTALDLLVGQSPDLGWKVDDDVIWVTTEADARGPMQLRTYDVRDLLMARTNFPAPRIQGLPTGEERYGGAQEEETTHGIDPDSFVDLIKNATDPDYWEETEGASIEVTETGMLLVRADAQMLGEIGGAMRAGR